MDMAGKKILFILFEGLPGFVIDSQVLIHAQMIQKKMGVKAEIWAFACNANLYEKSLDRVNQARKLANCDVKVFKGTRPALPWSRHTNSRKIYNQLKNREGEFGLIHARTDYTASVISNISEKIHIPYIWDCRGDSVAEFSTQFKTAPFWKKPLLQWRQNYLVQDRHHAARNCHGAIFVSNPLKKMNAAEVNGKPTAVIPCTASKELFYFSNKLRDQQRQKLGYLDNEDVYIYSGSMNPYQCFSEVVTHFSSVLKVNPKARLLVLTLAQEQAKAALGIIPEEFWSIKSAQLDEVNAYLNSADIAYMIRKACQLNAVASPTKFAEYALTGLPVIMTDAVIDTTEAAKRIGNYVQSNEYTYQVNTHERLSISILAAKELSRESMLPQYEFLYNSHSMMAK